MDEEGQRQLWDYQIDGCLVDSGIIIPLHEELDGRALAKLRAYHLADGSVAWDYPDYETGVQSFFPILAHQGKLLVHIESRTIWESPGYGVCAYDWHPSPSIGLNNFEVIGSEKIVLTPLADSRCEVIDLATGNILASKSLHGGYKDHIIMIPTGDPSITEFLEDDTLPIVVDVHAFSPRLVAGDGHGDTRSWRITGEQAVHVTLGSLGWPTVGERWRITQAMTSVNCRFCWPPPHAMDQACVSADGSFFVFPPTTWGGDRFLSLSSGQAREFVPLPAPNGPSDDRFAVAYDWEFNELWRANVGNTFGRVLALADNHTGIGYHASDVNRFRVVDAEGETVADRAGVGPWDLLATRGKLVTQRIGWDLQNVY